MASGNNLPIEGRKLVVSGSFYPSDPEELSTLLDNYFCKTKQKLEGKNIKALIVPHAGYIYSGQTAAWGYKQLAIDNFQLIGKTKPHFVLIGPSHNFYFEHVVSNNFDYWETPIGNVQHSVLDNRDIPIYNEAFIPEHCLEVQLPFLQHLVNNFFISCFLTGTAVNYKNTAEILINTYSSSIFIISSDLSHYLPQHQAQDIDNKTIDAIESRNIHYFQSNENVACGSGGISILLELAQIKKWKSTCVFYDTSATSSGDTSGVVGYAAVAFYE